MNENDTTIFPLRELMEIFISRSMRSLILFSKNRGLTMSQLGALFHLHHRGGCNVTDLGDELGITGAASSQMMERLVQQGLILRSENPADRRVKHLVLTDLGTQTVIESIHARQDWLEQLVNTLSDDERELVIPALNTIIAKTKSLEYQPDLNP